MEEERNMIPRWKDRNARRNDKQNAGKYMGKSK